MHRPLSAYAVNPQPTKVEPQTPDQNRAYRQKYWRDKGYEAAIAQLELDNADREKDALAQVKMWLSEMEFNSYQEREAEIKKLFKEAKVADDKRRNDESREARQEMRQHIQDQREQRPRGR